MFVTYVRDTRNISLHIQNSHGINENVVYVKINNTQCF